MTIEKIIAQIVDFDNKQVKLLCLFEATSKDGQDIFQLRKFDIEPFVGAVCLEINGFVQIKIETGEGFRSFYYSHLLDIPSNIKEKFIKHYENQKNYFEGLEDSPFFKSMSQE